MKVIGLIGGMSWESSAEYYRIINETVRDRLGPLYSAKSLMFTVNFYDIERLQHAERWDDAAEILIGAARRLERGGADCIVICTNTMHKLAGQVEAAVKIPLIHIADATAQRVQAEKIRKVGLLGTAFTMEQPFYKGRLTEKFGLEVVVPDASDRKLVHRIIYDELCQGKALPASKAQYVKIMNELAQRGAEGIILGCTEIMLLVGQSDSPVPVFDTTTLHALAAVDFVQEGALERPYG